MQQHWRRKITGRHVSNWDNAELPGLWQQLSANLQPDIVHIQVNYHFDVYFLIGLGTSTNRQGIFQCYHVVKEVLEAPFHPVAAFWKGERVGGVPPKHPEVG